MLHGLIDLDTNPASEPPFAAPSDCNPGKRHTKNSNGYIANLVEQAFSTHTTSSLYPAECRWVVSIYRHGHVCPHLLFPKEPYRLWVCPSCIHSLLLLTTTAPALTLAKHGTTPFARNRPTDPIGDNEAVVPKRYSPSGDC